MCRPTHRHDAGKCTYASERKVVVGRPRIERGRKSSLMGCGHFTVSGHAGAGADFVAQPRSAPGGGGASAVPSAKRGAGGRFLDLQPRQARHPHRPPTASNPTTRHSSPQAGQRRYLRNPDLAVGAAVDTSPTSALAPSTVRTTARRCRNSRAAKPCRSCRMENRTTSAVARAMASRLQAGCRRGSHENSRAPELALLLIGMCRHEPQQPARRLLQATSNPVCGGLVA